MEQTVSRKLKDFSAEYIKQETYDKSSENHITQPLSQQGKCTKSSESNDLLR